MSLSVHLIKKFPRFDLNCTFEAEKGLTVLFGYSGSGKSLTLQMISGLLAPDEGSVSLDGEAFFDKHKGVYVSPGERRIGYVFQENNLFPHMRIRENILFGARNLSRDRAERSLCELLSRLQIENVADHYPHEISGGQKKRVALAMALIGEPKLLLLDEPFSALDNPLRTKMRTCLADVMKGLDIPVILVTHDIVEAVSVADRILVYRQGEVVQSGTPAEVVANPLDENIAGLLEMPVIPKL